MRPELTRLAQRVVALELAAEHQAGTRDLGTDTGATDTAAGWANKTRQTKRDARRRLELAHALDHDHEPVRNAMAGTVSEEQAAVIVTGVDALPVEHRR